LIKKKEKDFFLVFGTRGEKTTNFFCWKLYKKKEMTDWYLIIIWILIVILIVVFVAWYITSMSHYSSTLLTPGQSYMVCERKYTFPNVDSTGPSYLLKDKFIHDIRTLIGKIGNVFSAMNIEWWITGGTLIGYNNFGIIPIPFDDDADIGVDDSNRTILFGPDFVAQAAKQDLKVIYFRGSSSKKANRIGACVRCQLLNASATLDIFFWKKIPMQKKVVKLDGWEIGKDIWNEKEQFEWDDVYPIQNAVKFDGLIIGVPNNPHNLLEKQYGNQVFSKCMARSLFVSHLGAFTLLPFMWTTTPPS